ncbi:Selenium-binding protein 1, partial [Calypte anna]
PREEVAYVTCTYRETGIDQPDFLATVDLNPCSPTYGQVIHRLPVPNLKDELHASGWSTGSTCPDNATRKWSKLVLPSLISSRIYVVDVGSQCRTPRLYKTIEPVDVFWTCNKGYLNVPRTLPNGDILIANSGDAAGHGKGGFIVLDGETFELKGNWEHESEVPPTGYDFWYQARHNVLVSSAGAVPRIAGRGFRPEDLKKGVYGRRLNVWNLSCRRLKGAAVLGCSAGAGGGWVTRQGVCTGSLQVFVGGLLLRCGPVTVCRDEELKSQPEPLVVKRVYGGPCKLQLSLDGKRLYVTNSFYSTWDKQFYPNLVKEGSALLQIDVDTQKGGLTVNKNFLVDFGKEPNGPCLAHEIHFSTGDS